jgi:hemerythrin
MPKIEKIKVATGFYVVEIPEAELSVLCGCPADAVKHLKKKGLIEPVNKAGITYETGPNAILLSDVLVQNGSFSNLTEFPVLQMLYLQGMILPDHPNNTGVRPMLIGAEDQVKAQMEYILRGNYGLVSKEEILATGIGEEEAEMMYRIKLKFAFGSIVPSHQLLDSRIVKNDPVEIRNGVYIRRSAFNLYEFSYKDETVIVDLNLAPGEIYEPPYQLGFHKIKREYFGVIHTGEGDGWDIDRPCMASIIMFQGKIYLVDAGPNIQTSLNNLGISINEIEGIFHTHAHDDHFAGLTTLARCDHKIKYYATPMVRASVAKKLCALMSMKEENFNKFFDVNDLEFDQWTDVNGLEVKPVYSPHPVETNIYFFRANWEGEYKTYAHLADIVSLDVFGKMITNDNSREGVSEENYNKIVSNYLTPVNLKKIDIGGGLIHGNAEDFAKDTSSKIVLAHTYNPLTKSQQEIGSSAPFGLVDVLIPSNRDYLIEFATDYLKLYFPQAPIHDINILLNCPVVSFNAGSILLKRGAKREYIYLLLTGNVDLIESKKRMQNVLSAGSLIGFCSTLGSSVSNETYRAASNIQVLQIPVGLYQNFIIRNQLGEDLRRLEENIHFLENTNLFGEISSFSILNRVAQVMRKITYKKNEAFTLYSCSELYLIQKGEVEIFSEGKKIETLSPGGFFSAENILSGGKVSIEVQVRKEVTMYTIPSDLIIDIPIIYWKLVEAFEKRFRNVIIVGE